MITKDRGSRARSSGTKQREQARLRKRAVAVLRHPAPYHDETPAIRGGFKALARIGDAVVRGERMRRAEERADATLNLIAWLMEA